jgi:hypothetical protein
MVYNRLVEREKGALRDGATAALNQASNVIKIT